MAFVLSVPLYNRPCRSVRLLMLFFLLWLPESISCILSAFVGLKGHMIVHNILLFYQGLYFRDASFEEIVGSVFAHEQFTPLKQFYNP